MEHKDAMAALNLALLDHLVPSGYPPLAKDDGGSEGSGRRSESAKITMANHANKERTSSKTAFKQAHPESNSNSGQKPTAPKPPAQPVRPMPIGPLKPLAPLAPIKPKL